MEMPFVFHVKSQNCTLVTITIASQYKQIEMLDTNVENNLFQTEDEKFEIR